MALYMWRKDLKHAVPMSEASFTSAEVAFVTMEVSTCGFGAVMHLLCAMLIACQIRFVKLSKFRLPIVISFNVSPLFS